MKKPTQSEAKIEAAGRELKISPPAVLAKTHAKSGAKAANEQRIAIMLSKARAAGAKIPQRKQGSK